MLKRFLIMISLMTAFNLMGQEENENINRNSVDIEGTENELTESNITGEKEAIDELEKKIQKRMKKYIDEYGKDADIYYINEEAELNALTESVISVIYPENYNYITGIDLADLIVSTNGSYCNPGTSIFDDPTDCSNYAYAIKNRYYVPQGLTSYTDTNLNKYLLIAAYYYGGTQTAHSIIIKFRLGANKIEKIYMLTSINLNNLHLGGIGYQKHSYIIGGGSPQTMNILFVTDYNETTEENMVKAYNMTPTSLEPLTINNQEYFYLDFVPAYLTVKDYFLWVGDFDDNEDDKPLNGYLLSVNPPNDISFDLKYQLEVPKRKLQGIYSITNSNTDKRLMFYLTHSWGDNQSYKYHAVLDAKDSNNDNIITAGEYFWESIYSPFNDFNISTDPNSQYYNGLPAGAEGITKLDGITYMANESATYMYNYWSKRVNKLILKINPLYFTSPVTQTVDMDNAGSITVNGSGIDNGLGYKIIIVMAQNKQGKFYYSMGELNYVSSTKLEVFVNKPLVLNPENFQASVNKKPSVYIEDVKGVYIMNLDETQGNSDDWIISSIDVNFDKNIFSLVNNSTYLYSKNVDIANTYLGDDSGDKKGYLTLFNFGYNQSFPKYQAGIYYNQSYQDLYDLYSYMNQCYYYNSNCFSMGESYIQTERIETFCNNIKNNINNSYLGRLTNVLINFCSN